MQTVSCTRARFQLLFGRRGVAMIGNMRFRDLARTIPGITDRMLSQRLKDLEAGGLVERVVHPSTPVQVEYRLTAKGSALGGVLLDLNQWALDWITLPGKAAGDPEPS